MSIKLDMLKCEKCNVILSKDIIKYGDKDIKIVCPVCKNKYKGGNLDDFDCNFEEVIL